jgi:hypothetical protein
VGWMTGVRLPAGAIMGFFIFATASGARPASCPVGIGASYPGVGRPGREAIHLLP